MVGATADGLTSGEIAGSVISDDCCSTVSCSVVANVLAMG